MPCHIPYHHSVSSSSCNHYQVSLYHHLISSSSSSSSSSSRIIIPYHHPVSSFHVHTELWGRDTCSLRRFQDGSITEAVVWESNEDNFCIGSVVEEIVNHIVKIHFPLYSAPRSVIYHLELPLVECRQHGRSLSSGDSNGVSPKQFKMLSTAAVRALDEFRVILASKLTG